MTLVYPCRLAVWRPAVPAAPQESPAAGVILAATDSAARREVAEVGAGIGDHELQDPPGPGLWLWTGDMVVEFGAGVTIEVSWAGSYARPHAVETVAVCRGESPWLLASAIDPPGRAVYAHGLCPACRCHPCACSHLRAPPLPPTRP